MRTLVLDRVPRKYNEGPFWGNGTTGSLLYIEDDVIRISFDHVRLWETRASFDSEVRPSFAELRHDVDGYHSGRYTTPTAPREDGPHVTRLPGLSFTIRVNSTVTAFRAVTDLDEALTEVRVTTARQDAATLRIYHHAVTGVLEIEWDDAQLEAESVRMKGWDKGLPGLQLLGLWGYPDAFEHAGGGFVHLVQPFGDGRAAVMSHLKRSEGTRTCIAVTLNVGLDVAVDQTEQANSELLTGHHDDRARMLERHRDSWRGYWQTADLQVPDEALQQAIDVERYKLYCNARPDSTPVTLQGIWNHDQAMPAWLGDLHNDLNLQACYWSAFRLGHADLVRPYIDLYFRSIPYFQERAKALAGVDGAISVPTLMSIDGRSAGTEAAFWNTLLGPELYAAIDFCWFYEYTQDEGMLRERLYPFLRGVADLYRGVAEKRADGRWHIPFTQSPEVFRDGRLLLRDDSTFVVSSLRYVLGHLVSYARILGLSEESTRWESFLHDLVDESTGVNGYLLMPGEELDHSHRHFSHLFPIFPLDLVDRGTSAGNHLMQASLDHVRALGFSGFAAFSFPYLAILAARGGRGNMSRLYLEIYCRSFRSVNTFTVNGDAFDSGILTPAADIAGEPDDVFTLEAGLMVPAAVAEMMVHRTADTLWVLPAMPRDWGECTASDLRVEGGHRVSVQLSDYVLRQLQIQPGCDEELTIMCRRSAGLYVIESGDDSFETELNGPLTMILHRDRPVTITSTALPSPWADSGGTPVASRGGTGPHSR